jgi:hypothetical protein
MFILKILCELCRLYNVKRLQFTVGSCEYGNTPSGSIKRKEFLDFLNALSQLLKKDCVSWRSLTRKFQFTSSI